jgi:ligand-binding sensor protein
MSWKLKEIIDFKSLSRLFDAFHAATGIAVSIVSLDGNTCANAGYQKICSDFYLQHPESAPTCLQNEAHLHEKLIHAKDHIVHCCPYGLLNGGTPIVVDNTHVANLFTGKFLFAPPDGKTVATFKKQAAKWRFDEKAFIGALMDIPIISQDRLTSILHYLKQLSEMIGEMGFNRLKLKESERSLLDVQVSLKAVRRQLSSLPVDQGWLRRRGLSATTRQNRQMALLHRRTDRKYQGDGAGSH